MEPLKKLCVVCRTRKENINQLGIRLDLTKDQNSHLTKLIQTKKTLEKYIQLLEDKSFVITDKDRKTLSVYLGWGVSTLVDFPTHKGKRGYLKRKLVAVNNQIENASHYDLKYPAFACSEECFNMFILSVS